MHRHTLSPFQFFQTAMKIISKIVIAAVSAIMLFSCNEDLKEASDVAMFITPGASAEVSLSSGDVVRYKVDFYTTSDYVSKFKIESFDSYLGNIIHKDTTFNEKVSSLNFDFRAPATDRDSLPVTLTFSAWDNKGHKCEATRTLIIKNKQILSDEKNGIVLWKPGNNLPDALSFSDPSQTFCMADTPDSARADLYITCDDSFENISLLSNTKAGFVRNNNFNYAEATAISIQSVYSGSRFDDVIRDLRVNDIILVGHNKIAEGVFRVHNIIRTGNNNEKCIQLAFKGISQ